MRANVPPTKRRKLSKAAKVRIWTARGGLCAWCKAPVEQTGPGVVYDHFVPLFQGGRDDDTNIRPLHASPCDKIKTAFDHKRNAKLRRQRLMSEPKKPKRKIASPGFQGWQRFNGEIVKRARP